MNETVYVFGHQNPDTDSICSAISYSYLKNIVDKSNKYIPVGLKAVNKETLFVLNYFKVEPPRIVKSLKPQVSDIKLDNYAFVRENDSIKAALEAITHQVGRSIPVVDSDERLIGVVSISDIVPRLLSLGDKGLLKTTGTPIGNVIRELGLDCAFDPTDTTVLSQKVSGNVYVSTDLLDDKTLSFLGEEDIVICNTMELARYFGKVGCIIVGNIMEASGTEALKVQCDTLAFGGMLRNTKVYSSKQSAFELVKALAQTTPITSVVIKEGLEYFVTYETIDDVKENMLSSKFRRFPVVDERGKIIGMISRSNLVFTNKKKAILVDHNERGQSIEGIEDIEILEIIDHHRVADVMTIAPLYFRVEPLGCTCTIIARLYEERNVIIPKDMAGIMLSAIISDTLLFNSPTCTQEDKDVAYRLAKIAEVDPRWYGMKMIQEGSDIQHESPYKILTYDRKKFMFGKYKVAISQINTGDFDGFFRIFEDVMIEMNRMIEEDGYNLFVLMVTDVVVGGTEIVATGDSKWIADSAFGIRQEDLSIFLPNVFSRKKQVVPKLMNAALL